ncbi:MAG: hypothetical protein KKC37_14925 [Proteobacteria bacterium]|nr:hypothetical protein [Pseudomonadota bacterium]
MSEELFVLKVGDADVARLEMTRRDADLRNQYLERTGSQCRWQPDETHNPN